MKFLQNIRLNLYKIERVDKIFFYEFKKKNYSTIIMGCNFNLKKNRL